MCHCYTEKQICLKQRLRQLWEQHVYWKRFFIISTIANLSDLQAVTNRLLQNPKDFANLLITFYGAKAAKQFEQFFTQHLLIAADLVNAAKNNEVEKLNVSRKKWYQNADEIACFLSEINPYWDKNKWQTMLYRHLEMTEEEAVLRLQGNYDADIKNFANIENEALQMADYMFCGILKQYL